MCGTVTVGGDSNSERGQIEDRPAITIRKAGDEVEAGPGFFEGDTVVHCGPMLKGRADNTAGGRWGR